MAMMIRDVFGLVGDHWAEYFYYGLVQLKRFGCLALKIK